MYSSELAGLVVIKVAALNYSQYGLIRWERGHGAGSDAGHWPPYFGAASGGASPGSLVGSAAALAQRLPSARLG